MWPESAWDLARHLSRLHVPTLGVRSLDVLHVAAALALNAESFYTFDARQRKLATVTGLPCRP